MNDKDKAKTENGENFMNLSNLDEKCKPNLLSCLNFRKKQSIYKKNQINEKFEDTLELTSILFQSILGLNGSYPSNHSVKNQKIAGISLKKLSEKVNELHEDIISQIENKDLIKNKIKVYKEIVEDNSPALKIYQKFEQIAENNINKLNLLLNDFKLFLTQTDMFLEKELNGEVEYQKNLKLVDSLLKLIILTHKPLGKIFNRYN